MNILIIGGGVAAFEAAVAAAAQGIHKVTLCSKEAVPPYRRPALSRMVAEEVADNAFYFKPASFYEEHGIELLLEKEAVSHEGWRASADNYEGIRINADINCGNGWFLLRLSVHDPIIVLNAESNENGGIMKMLKDILNFIKKQSQV